MSDAILDIQGIGISFGGLRAVNDFTLALRKGGLQGLIGPNGAGKTTIFNLMTGVYQPDRGDIRLDGVSLLGKRPSVIASTGLARTFQNIRLFGDLPVIDNVRIAFLAKSQSNLLQTLLRTPAWVAEDREITRRARAFTELLGPAARRLAGT